MTRNDLKALILTAPAWARVGITVRDSRLRERAADALAALISDRLEDRPQPHKDQLALPL